VAVIQDGVDAGGSYVFVQRWEHNLKQLNRMSVPEQEMMIGRTKEANEEIDGDARPETSHLSRVDLKGRRERVEDCASEPALRYRQRYSRPLLLRLLRASAQY
jgi:Predicted iron-dependent peroxidase